MEARVQPSRPSIMTPGRMPRPTYLWVTILAAALVVAGCAHYPVNQPITKPDPDSGYRAPLMGTPGNSEHVLLYLTFSGGGTRAAAFAYGVLEELRNAEVTFDGKNRRLLEEVDVISSVSGGSFTAGYYGLFGERIFEDFETKFLKKNIQGALLTRIIFNPYNWLRLLSPAFDRSDIAAEYYDKKIFDHGTFQDMAARKGPMININATDMVTGIRLGFTQEAFDIICSDLSTFPVARAAAASSAVPILLTPVSLRNYAGSCGYTLPQGLEKVLQEQDTTSRQFHLVNDMRPYLDADKRKYIHLVDGGVSDNLGLRMVLDRVTALGSAWNTLKWGGLVHTHKIAFIVVNAETAVGDSYSFWPNPPAIAGMLQSYSSIAITRYNYETIMLLRENFKRWTEEVQKGRCGEGPLSTEPGACGDIKFYLIEVKFAALKDPAERSHFMELPTSFQLPAEEVDKLREAARRILTQSGEYQQFLRDLQNDSGQ